MNIQQILELHDIRSEIFEHLFDHAKNNILYVTIHCTKSKN